MSEEFYKYLSNKLLKFFIDEHINAGDKFFIEFDEEKDVDLLYNSLKNETQSNNLSYGTFEYRYENGKAFKTYYIDINHEFKLIVANSFSVTTDYMVTLRNAAAEQRDIWKNTVLLIIGYNINDSIQEGMRDLQKEGMPLHFKTICDNLINEVYDKNNGISMVDREIIKFDIESKMNSIYESNLWDYEDVLGLINKGHIDKDDLKEIKLFYDPVLEENLRPNSIQKRLEKNHNIFVNVEDLHRYDNTEDKLAKRFDMSCTKQLNSKNWMDTEFNYILKHNTPDDGSINYIESENKLTVNDNLIYWEKPFNFNKAGLQKRHIIIFNEKECENVTLEFQFDKRLSKKYLTGRESNKFAEISGKKIIAHINTSIHETTFAKIQYKHKNLPKLKYEFNIAVVNCNESLLEPIKADYTIVTKDSKRKGIITHKSIEITNEDTSTPIIIGSGDKELVEEIEENGQEVYITDENSIKISENSSAWSLNEKLYFLLNYNSFNIPISIKEERNRAIPTSSLNIWNLKRQNESSFIFNGSKVTQGVNSFYITEDFKKILSYEKDIIMNGMMSGNININNTIDEIKLDISENLRLRYDHIIQYYKNLVIGEEECAYPSLTYLNRDLELLYEEFLDEYNKEIESIEENKALSGNKSKHDLNKVGLFYTNNEIYFSSLSPINMAYQLEVKKQLANEKIDNNILNRINNENLIPYIHSSEDILFKPTTQDIAKEWIKYEKEEQVSIGSTNQFISKVIEQKINDFVDNFNYLFIEESKAPIKLNIINIKQDKEIVKGIFNFINKRIEKNREIIPIELNLYNNAEKSSFDDFFVCDDAKELEKLFGIKIKSKQLDESDLLHLIQNNITYYKNTKKLLNDYEYAHISFFKLEDKTYKANHTMDEIETGLSLNGILSDPTSFNSDSGYRIGFGTKGILDKNRTLIRTVINYNELEQNNKNKGNDSYTKGQTIVSQPMEPKDQDIEKLYEKSLWVTFIEPNFGLEYFENRKHIIIIHYSDQYTSSNKYDTITVTDKSKQYKNILKSFLKTKKIVVDEERINNVIKVFNGINGEWLLRVMKDNNYNSREKLSVISAIKYMYGLLNHQNIVWIPISMEEILRIAGTVGLSKNEGLFKKSLLKGRFSDDILFIGINIGSSIKVYYHPVEVKQGIISSTTISKAEEQLENTINLIKEQFLENQDNIFKSRFYRNFFIQLAIANMNKLRNLDFWSTRKIDKIDEIKPFLLNDQYEVSDELDKYIGEGSVMAFNTKRDSSIVSCDKNIQIVEMPDEFAYNGLTRTIKEICDHIINKSDFKEENLLSNKMQKEQIIFKPENKEEKNIPEQTPTTNNPISIVDMEKDKSNKQETTTPLTENEDISDDVDKKEEDIDEIIETNTIPDLEDVKALIGTVPHGNKKIYWEYGSSQLSNRHMLILGKSGYGKTYFMQCLIKEMSKQHIPTLIIDYSDAFMNNEIQEELKEYLGEDLIKINVKMKKFPLNPFRKNKIEYDENEFVYEENIDIASRIKSVFSSVYNLGIVQQNTLVKAINNGLEKHGEDMSFDNLMEELDDPENKNALSVLNQLNEFLLFNPFRQESEFEWSDLDNRNKKVIILQLHGYSHDIQKIITEFILWDLWNYKSLNGTSEKAFNVILDEAQNLDYSDDSPCVKILKEGRKKGWSVWFATQSIKGLLKNSDLNPFNNANQIIYFHPADNVKNIASEFTTNNQDKSYWAEKLSNLKKGECISYGATRNLEGNLNPPRPSYVEIDSLENR